MMTLSADALGAALLAIVTAIGLTTLRCAIAAAVDLFQRNDIIRALQLTARDRAAEHLRPGKQIGGGGADHDFEVRATRIAGALRQLGEQVNAPGLKAIQAVLLVNLGACQVDAASRTGSTVKSIRKYAPLVQKVLASAGMAAVVAAAVAVAPVSAGVACGTVAAAVLPPLIKSLPNVTNVSLKSEIYPQDGHIYRVWRATMKAPDGTLHERETLPVLHEPPPADEASVAREQRENREHKRIVRALRALDEQALAAYRAKDCARKRTKAAQRLSRLPALPIPEGDPAWSAPLGERPLFVGEHVWLLSSDASAPPQLATIRGLWRDESVDITVQQTQERMRTTSDRLVTLGARVPS